MRLVKGVLSGRYSEPPGVLPTDKAFVSLSHCLADKINTILSFDDHDLLDEDTVLLLNSLSQDVEKEKDIVNVFKLTPTAPLSKKQYDILMALTNNLTLLIEHTLGPQIERFN